MILYLTIDTFLNNFRGSSDALTIGLTDMTDTKHNPIVKAYIV